MIGSKYKDIMKHLRKFLKGFNDINISYSIFMSFCWYQFKRVLGTLAFVNFVKHFQFMYQRGN